MKRVYLEKTRVSNKKNSSIHTIYKNTMHGIQYHEIITSGPEGPQYDYIHTYVMTGSPSGGSCNIGCYYRYKRNAKC